MYINKIDELVDKIIDEFYNKIFLKKEYSKFFDEINFVKYQLDINKIFIDNANKINKSDINKILNDEDNTNKLVELIKKYMGYYIFMLFAFFYKGKIETYINNIVEFTKNQPEFNFKIINFFNSESNSIVIKFYNMIKNILTLLDADSGKLQQLAKRPDFTDPIQFLNEFGQEFVNSNFKLQNLNGNVKEQAHNIIKTIIISELYFKIDKKDVYEFLEKSEKDVGEFIYIDIVVPRIEFIDFNTIELSLSKRDVEKGLASEIYDLITGFEEISRIADKSNEEKISELINNKIIVPISEDFLLYHKDSEKYEKITGLPQVTAQTKKKDDTKIKYVINKIDNATELFSKNTQEKPEVKKTIEKLFYPPFSDRRVVLINNYEDVKIINKLQNQGRRAIENNEYFNDLLTYREYPYINFKNFQKYGFVHPISKTIDVVRSINFEKVAQINKNKPIQFRVGSEGNMLNIVGFIVPPANGDIKCVKLREFVDIRKIGYKEDGQTAKTDNGYNITIKVLKKKLFSQNKSSIPTSYWMFDLEKDKIKFDKYDAGVKMDDTAYIKMIAGKFYDDVLLMINNEILKYFDKKKMTLQNFFKLFKKIDSQLLEFPKNIPLYNNLEKIFYYQKVISTEDKYDKKEDEFPGIIGQVIKLPNAPPKKINPPVLILEKFKKQSSIADTNLELMEAEQLGAICQHNITWDNISAIRSKNHNKFSELLFEFFQQYIIKNHEGDFICKSCGGLINLKNYVLDGTYDSDGRFVSFNMPLEIPIEDIPEYEKYKSTIRNLEKIIERIASISNINTLTGTSYTIKGRIKKVVKDTIDLVVIHNANLKNIYKERSEKISIYGLNKELSNLFIFDLDNSIFVYSSKDKDYYKPIKRNNIIIYILFLMMLELSDSQLLYMTGDKICNYYLFSKFGINWFNNIQIRKNNQNTIAPILNYKVLCYLIFYMSCQITKYGLWYYETEEVEKKKKFDPNVQKIIINTFIDFLNSIIEMYGRKKKHYIYDIVANKFFQKLSTTFQNETILERIKTIDEKKIVTTDKKNKVKKNIIEPIPLVGEYKYVDYNGDYEWVKCKLPKYIIKKRVTDLTRYYQISNVTNCPDGKFHSWQMKGDKLICSICGTDASVVNIEDNISAKILENYKILALRKLAKVYCKSGEFHNFIYNSNIDCKICTKCKTQNVDQFDNKDLIELAKNVDIMKQEKENKKMIQAKKQKSTKIDFINEIKNNYGLTKKHKEDYQNFVDIFIKKVENILGKDINLNNQNIFLRNDAYIVDHDHNGYSLDKPFTITNTEGKISFKKDHSFFKKDVLYYTNYKLQIDIFYDALTKLLLGYKEKNKDFQLSKKQNIYLKVNNSIYSRLTTLGYPSRYIEVTDKINSYKEFYPDQNDILIHIISDISRNRIQNLKKVITDLQRYINRIAFNFNVKPIDEEHNPDMFMDKYKNKLSKIILGSGKDKFMYKWKVIKYDLFFESILNKVINLDIDSKFFSIDDISNYDYIGNLVLYYIVTEMGKLLDLNQDKFIKATLSYLLLDIIVREYDEFDEEKDLTNTEIKRFKYVLAVEDLKDVEEIGGETEGFYEEFKDPDAIIDDETMEMKDEDREEFEALDVETIDIDDTLDYEIDYASGVNYNYEDSYIDINEGDGNNLI
jgi:hypothetical protein